jgi:hypothetical protein
MALWNAGMTLCYMIEGGVELGLERFAVSGVIVGLMKEWTMGCEGYVAIV